LQISIQIKDRKPVPREAYRILPKTIWELRVPKIHLYIALANENSVNPG